MKKLLKVLEGETVWPPPVWLMRQAGRYLAEYRELKKTTSLLNLFTNPQKACAVTLQPLQRFDLDAAIVFTDILFTASSLGQKLSFHETQGPQLTPCITRDNISTLQPNKNRHALSPVYQTLQHVVKALPSHITLLGFAGCPWTVATYMAGNKGTGVAKARQWIYEDPASFGQLITLLTDVTADYVCQQVRAGAQAIQLFESAAGEIPGGEFTAYCTNPVRYIINKLRQQFPHVPVILYAKGASQFICESDFVATTGVTAISVDPAYSLKTARQKLAHHALSKKTVLQGNLDPLTLVKGGRLLEESVKDILASMQGYPFIFNLGHGVLKQTPPERVAHLLDAIQRYA